MREWNRSGARVRFRPARRSRADVWITRWPTYCRGFAQIGYDAANRHARLRLAAAPTRAIATAVAAHELGHILGLGHERRRCAAMNTATSELCLAGPYHVPCHPLERDDVRGAVRLYGGRVRVGPRRLCARFAAPEPPAELRVTRGPDGAGTLELVLRPRRTLIAGSVPPPRQWIVVHRYADACPPGPPSGVPDAEVIDDGRA